MDMAKINKYKKIYNEKVLPKKSVSRNTPESLEKSLKILDEYSIYRCRANELGLRGKHYGEE